MQTGISTKDLSLLVSSNRPTTIKKLVRSVELILTYARGLFGL